MFGQCFWAGVQSLSALFGDRGNRRGFSECKDLLMNILVSCYWDLFYIASKGQGLTHSHVGSIIPSLSSGPPLRTLFQSAGRVALRILHPKLQL